MSRCEQVAEGSPVGRVHDGERLHFQHGVHEVHDRARLVLETGRRREGVGACGSVRKGVGEDAWYSSEGGVRRKYG